MYNDDGVTDCCDAAGIKVPATAVDIFNLSFFTGFGTSSIVYFVLCHLFPVPGVYDIFQEVDISCFEVASSNELTESITIENIVAGE